MIILANVQRQFMDCHYQSCIDIFAIYILADVRCLWIVIKIMTFVDQWSIIIY